MKQRAQQAKDRGASAVEYALLVTAIAAVIVGVVMGMGSVVHAAFERTCQSMQVPVASSCQVPDTSSTGT